MSILLNSTMKPERIQLLKKTVFILLRIGFGVLLIAASLDKIQHPLQFAQLVENYQVIGERLSRWIAIWLPYLELIVGLLLIIGFWVDTAVFINALLMLLFLAMVTQAYARGLDINCGCFSTEGGAQVSLAKLAENFFLTVGALLLVFLDKSLIFKK